MEMLKSALAIYNRLLETGQIESSQDSELYLEYKNEDVRRVLEQFEEELNFKLLDTGSTIYLIPGRDNDILGYVMKDFREEIASDARLADAYLQCYISMMIFQMFYGGKNTNPIQREFIQAKDLMEGLDRRMDDYLGEEENTSALEEEYGINFGRIAQVWKHKQIGDGITRKSKMGTLQRAFSQLEKAGLIRVLESGGQIRRTKRMDDLFLYYYLDEERVQELHGIFEQPLEKEAQDA